MTEKALAEEVAFYEEHFEEYRRKYAGRYVLWAFQSQPDNLHRFGGDPRMSPNVQPLHVAFTATPEIFATDSMGAFVYPLAHELGERVDTLRYDEMRFVVSVWHPREGKNIDLDKAYLELRANFVKDGHWTRLAELEPVVSPYQRGETFDGWIVLPVLSGDTALRLHGGGFQPRTRVQIRSSAYFVA